MKERPILFSAPMVRAILAGTKTQTRRVVKAGHRSAFDGKVTPAPEDLWRREDGAMCLTVDDLGGFKVLPCPYGEPGDQLWVREAWRTSRVLDKQPPRLSGVNSPFWYLADDATKNVVADRDHPGRYRHARFMPRWASRDTLEVVAVRVERLQDISDKDAMAEGVNRRGNRLWENYLLPNAPHGGFSYASNSFRSLWESINGPGSWEANPWVRVVEFKRVLPGTASKHTQQEE